MQHKNHLINKSTKLNKPTELISFDILFLQWHAGY